MKKALRILGFVSLGAAVLAGAAIAVYWAFFPHPVVDEAAEESLRQSFDFAVPNGFTRRVGSQSALGLSFFMLADEDYRFVIAANTGLRPDQVSEVGVLPDYAGETDWELTSKEQIVIRAQDVDLLKYAGHLANGSDLIGWVIVFAGKDGTAKVSIIGYPGFFDHGRALQFIRSIR